MPMLVLAVAWVLQAVPVDGFLLRCDVQGVYDELSQATLASRTAKDVELFHDVFYAPNWVFVDGQGHRQFWTDLREQTIRDAARQPFTAVRQAIQDITPLPDGATALINVITIRTVTDNDGTYGRSGLTHTIAEVTPMRDTWNKTATGWKLRVREQLGAPKVFVDKMPPDIENPRCPSS